jgi:hypothetical protein
VALVVGDLLLLHVGLVRAYYNGLGLARLLHRKCPSFFPVTAQLDAVAVGCLSADQVSPATTFID